MIKQEPAFVCLDRRRAGSHLGRLPGRGGSEDKPVAAPMDQVRAFGVEDIPERRMPGIAWTMQHGVLPVELAGKQHGVAVVGKHDVFQELERGEVGCFRQSDGRRSAVRRVMAERDIVHTVNRCDARIVRRILRAVQVRNGMSGGKPDRFVGDSPVDAVDAGSRPQLGIPLAIVDTEYAGIAGLRLDDRTVQNTVAVMQRVGRDDGIVPVPGEHAAACPVRMRCHALPSLCRPPVSITIRWPRPCDAVTCAARRGRGNESRNSGPSGR